MPKARLQLSPPQFLAVSFLALIITGALLLSLPWAAVSGQSDFLTALFTSTSAACVTGLVVVDTAQHWSFLGKLVILLLVQVGGLGIMSFAVFYALILGKKIQFRQRLLMQEAVSKNDTGGVVGLFRNLLLFTFSAEAIGTLILAARWSTLLGWKQALWFGLFHAVGAFNNGAFDLWGNNKGLTDFVGDPVVNLVMCGLIILGGLGFIVIDDIIGYHRRKSLSLHSRVVVCTTLALVFGGALVFYACEYNNSLAGMPVKTQILASLFQSVTPRTAGFNTLDIAGLLPATNLLLIVLMFIGGSPGSTAGGIKTSTMALLLAAVRSQIRGRREPELMKRRIPYEDLTRALSVAFIYTIIVILVTFLLMLTHHEGLMITLFEVCSALGTVGLTLGLTAKLTAFGKCLLIVTMFLGRVGPLSLAFALAYNKKSANYRYPAGKVMIG